VVSIRDGSRAFTSALGLFCVVLAAVGLLAIPAAGQPADNAASKIEGALAASLAARGSAEFIVYFKDQADTSFAKEITGWAQRGQAVMQTLQRAADQSQAGVRSRLDGAHARYRTFWIVNAIYVENGSTDLVNSIAADPEVAQVRTNHRHELPEPTPRQAEQAVDAVEWGIAAINADDAWGTFGARGEGIVVANIDTGVQYEHPALVRQYRGNQGGGVFDHNYNWIDPSHICGSPSFAPCDNNGHGTHTMGTMVGEDASQTNQIGVAPAARWIAAKGCEYYYCSDFALIATGQWVTAPTDLTFANPRPDLRPHVVNNSWGSANGPIVDPWYEDIVLNWIDAGIFPAFSIGNNGPGCDSAGSPGDYVETYASGAFDINGDIAWFSSRGPGENGEIKPNIAAPGVDVRSSLPGNGYGFGTGTSMASPHTAGTAALMMSAAPSLIGDVNTTRLILDDSATDTPDDQCGGTDDDNNVWGEGKLNAFAAVEQSPRGPTGTLVGTVTNADDGAPIAGARVEVTGPNNRTVMTGADGTYRATLPIGDYTVTVSAFGFENGTANVTITEGQTTTQDIALTQAPSFTVSGVINDNDGNPVANATIMINGTPIPPATSGADGSYSFSSVPTGTYTISAAAGECFESRSQSVIVDGDETVNFTLPVRGDSYGYRCVIEGAGYVEGDTPLPIFGDGSTQVDLPFPFLFYGNTYSTAFVAGPGHINFQYYNSRYWNDAIPDPSSPNAAIYPFWDDMWVDGSSVVRTKTAGTAPNRTFLIEWNNVTFFGESTRRVDFEAELAEDGTITFRYRNLGNDLRERGNSATVGIEDHNGAVALQYSFNTATLSDSQSIRFRPPPTGIVTGTVTDFNDGQPVEGAQVQTRSDDGVVSTLTTGPDGTYSGRLLLGTYTIEASKQYYVTQSASITLDEPNETVTRNFALHTPRATITPDALSFVAVPGQLRSATVVLANPSDLDLAFNLTSDSTWLWPVPNSGTVRAGASRNLTVRADPEGLEPGVYQGTLTLTTNAGRTPTILIPVSLVVPAYQVGVDSGSTSGLVDRAGDAWVADRAWTAGGFGYVGAGSVNSTRQGIAGTDDDALYQTQRESTNGYRFDTLPAGTYQVELSFAELRHLAPGVRVFDVKINGQVVLLAYDPVAAVGTFTADRRVFSVAVPAGGSINVELLSRRSQQNPTINAVRVTHRPDM
jgi:subtilisin family serine protease